ncbi:MAG: YciK family oxidoreductase, partial [Methylophagaceae bacterium]
MNYSAASDLLLDSVILVTGAGDGVGAAVAKS